ncbi:MAG: O-antigen ligase family protein [Candidatus Omnitrophica bacterium]|nr:O-antigen ligase family protein [Candidatus Omnitrophota bacterium]
MRKERYAKIFDYICEYSLYGLIFFIPISSAAVESFFGFAFLGFILKKISKPDFKFLGTSYNFFLWLFVIFMCLSLFNSGIYIEKSLKTLFFKWLEYITIFIIAQDIINTKIRLRNALGIMLFVAVLVGIDGVIQKLWGIEYFRHRPLVQASSGLYFISGPFNHYNAFGTYLMVTSLIFTALLLERSFAKKIKFFLALFSMLLVACLLLTSSRGAWIAYLSALGLMFVISKRFKAASVILGLFLIVLLFVPGIKERFNFTLSAQGDARRFAIWRSALLMIKENPYLGKGLGTFMDYFPHYYKHTRRFFAQYAHNCFLQIWAETGIFSLISFLLTVSVIFKKSLKKIFKAPDCLLIAFTCAIFGFLVNSFFDTQLYSLQLAVLFWILLGLAAAKINLA